MKRIRTLIWAGLVIGLTGCATTPEPRPDDQPQTDPMIVQWSANAQDAFENGHYSRAATLYRMTVDRATMADNSLEIGRAAFNLAVCESILGNVDDARDFLRRAERAFERAGHPVAEVLLLDAKFARQLGHLGEAEQRINEAERMELPRALSVEAYLLRAHIACDRSNPSQAEAFLARAQGRIGDPATPAQAANVDEVTARIHELHGRTDRAAEAYERQAGWLSQAGLFREMADALTRAGQAWQNAGEAALATDRFYRAARSLVAQGDHLTAMQVIETAVLLQDEPLDDEALVKEVAELFEEIRQSVALSQRTTQD